MEIFRCLIELIRHCMGCLPHHFAAHVTVIAGHIAHGVHVLVSAFVANAEGVALNASPLWTVLSAALLVVAVVELMRLLRKAWSRLALRKSRLRLLLDDFVQRVRATLLD